MVGWIGPEIPGKGRRLTASEARRFHNHAGLVPDQVAKCLASDVGPFEAARLIGEGLTLDETIKAAVAARSSGESLPSLAWRSAGFSDVNEASAWRHAGLQPPQARIWIERCIDDPALAKSAEGSDRFFNILRSPSQDAATEVSVIDDGLRYGLTLQEIIDWFGDDSSVPIRGFIGPEVAQWRGGGFNPATAGAWAATGLDPEQCRSLVANGATPEGTITNRIDEEVFVWSDRFGFIQLASRADANWTAEIEEINAAIFAASSWELLRTAIQGTEHETAFNETVRELWSESGDESDGDPPEGWLPGGVPRIFDGDWYSNQPRINDPYSVSLPQEVREIARGAASMVGGEFVSWDKGTMIELARIFRQLGFAFVNDESHFFPTLMSAR